MDMFSFAVLVGAFVGLALVFGMVLWSMHRDSPYLAKRALWFLVSVVLMIVSVIVVARPATDEFWLGLQEFGFLSTVIVAAGFFIEAFESDAKWRRELRRIATHR